MFEVLAAANVADLVGLRVHLWRLVVAEGPRELAAHCDVVLQPVVLQLPVPEPLEVVDKRLLIGPHRAGIVVGEAAYLRWIVFFVDVGAEAVVLLQLQKNEFELLNLHVVVDREQSEAGHVVVDRRHGRHNHLHNFQVGHRGGLGSDHIDVVDVCANRKQMVLLERFENLHQLFGVVGEPENLLALVIVEAEENMNLRHKLHVRVCLQRLIEPLQHQVSPVLDLHIV